MITVVSLGVVGASIFGGIKAYQNYQANNLTAEVMYVSNLNAYYGETGTSSSGMVTNDYSQDVYAFEDQAMLEVFVEEGQAVEAGDPLVSYDVTLAKLELEMKELDVSTNASKTEAAKRQLEKLKNTKPVTPRPEVPEEPDIPEPEPEPVIPEKPERIGDAYNFIRNGSLPNEGSGTEEDPYVYLCMPECYVLGEFINNLSADRKKPIYVSFEIRKDNVMTGKLISAWAVSGRSGFPQMAEDSRWSVRTRSQVMEEEEPEFIDIPEEPEVPDIPEPVEPEGYTSEQLSEMIKEKEQEIRDLDLQGRKLELELEQMKKVTSDGIVKAEITGVVKNLADKDTPPADGSPLLTVTGSEGLYVSGALSELQ